MARNPIRALVVGIDDEHYRELTQEEGFTVERADRLDEETRPTSTPWSLALTGEPLEALATLRAARTRRGRGRRHRRRRTSPTARSRCTREPTITSFAGRSRRACSRGPSDTPSRVRRLRRELATQDDETGLPNLRGFAPIAEHHLRMADRATPPVGLPVRPDRRSATGRRRERRRRGGRRWRATRRHWSLEAVRDADVPARISADTFCVLLTGEARGAEALVLSRLVEAIAVNDARLDQPRARSRSRWGAPCTTPISPSTLEQIFSNADRRLAEQAARWHDPRNS